MQQRLRRRVEADDRLVEHEHLRRADERAGELRLLAHAARELARQEVARAPRPSRSSSARCARRSRPSATPCESVDQLEVLADGEVVVEQRRVGHERERGAGVLGVGSRWGSWPHTRTRAGPRLEQPGDRAHGGRLAAAVGADERDALAGATLRSSPASATRRPYSRRSPMVSSRGGDIRRKGRCRSDEVAAAQERRGRRERGERPGDQHREREARVPAARRSRRARRRARRPAGRTDPRPGATSEMRRLEHRGHGDQPDDGDDLVAHQRADADAERRRAARRRRGCARARRRARRRRASARRGRTGSACRRPWSPPSRASDEHDAGDARRTAALAASSRRRSGAASTVPVIVRWRHSPVIPIAPSSTMK